MCGQRVATTCRGCAGNRGVAVTVQVWVWYGYGVQDASSLRHQQERRHCLVVLVLQLSHERVYEVVQRKPWIVALHIKRAVGVVAVVYTCTGHRAQGTKEQPVARVHSVSNGSFDAEVSPSIIIFKVQFTLFLVFTTSTN